MTIEQLRMRHPRLIYQRFSMAHDAAAVRIGYEFLLEPDIVFRPTLVIPYSGPFDEAVLAPYVFHLGLVEAISYWKAACPGAFVVEAGPLSPEQIRFWYDLFIHGLGEFLYRNQIDFTKPDFLTIVSRSTESSHAVQLPHAGQSDLVLVGGGKDSAVTLGILKQSDRTIQTMILNPTQAALDNVRVSGFPDPIVVTRTIDPKLLELNAAGYLNGHTPFSAYLAFLGLTVAALYGNAYVIVSNEQSANEGNVMYRGMEINHQYSKSFRFEQLFRAYAAEQFPGGAEYFSVLRPLNDLQIGRLFAGYPMFDRSFRSCNAGSKTGVWCGTCAKCAFTYLTLSPFLPYERIMEIFGSDYFRSPEILGHLTGLVGLVPVKPFECVGSRDESKLAVLLSVEKYLADHREVPEGLLRIKSDLALTDQDKTELAHRVMEQWGETYNVPADYASIIRAAWERAAGAIQHES